MRRVIVPGPKKKSLRDKTKGASSSYRSCNAITVLIVILVAFVLSHAYMVSVHHHFDFKESLHSALARFTLIKQTTSPVSTRNSEAEESKSSSNLSKLGLPTSIMNSKSIDEPTSVDISKLSESINFNANKVEAIDLVPRPQVATKEEIEDEIDDYYSTGNGIEAKLAKKLVDPYPNPFSNPYSSSIYAQNHTPGYQYVADFPIHDMFKHINFDELVAKSLPSPKSGHLEAFASHPYHSLPNSSKKDLLTYMVSLQNVEACRKKPLFVTLAKVQNDLYWQLIENFFYTMYMFNNLECSVMICISDTLCMERCNENKFPCFDYDPVVNSPKENNVEGVSPLTKHVMEHVAEIKLFHVGEAVKSGVNIMLLDLDVGFLRDPLLLYQGFLENPYEHVRAQMDMGFSTNQSANHAWYAHPRPNFGLFLIKAHPFSSKVFNQAWKSYLKIDDNQKKIWEEAKRTGIKPNRNRIVDKTHVAIDQNTIVGALKWARWRFDYNFSYFYLGFMLDIYPRPIIPLRVVLLDKMPLINRNSSSKIINSDGSGKAVYVVNSDRVFRGELGGVLANALLDQVVAAHATCHEGGTKLLGLKAANAFWNNKYYSNTRKTITKPLIFLSKRQLTREILALYYIAMKTNRSLIIPNVLIGVGSNIRGQLDASKCRTADTAQGALLYSYYCQERIYLSSYFQEDMSHAHKYRDEHYWPSWRTVKQIIEEVQVVEPAYYYRLQTNYYEEKDIPKPYIHTIDVASSSMQPEDGFHKMLYDPNPDDNTAINDIIKGILEADNGKELDTTRLVLEVKDSRLGPFFTGNPVLIPRDAKDDSKLVSSLTSEALRGSHLKVSLSAWAYDSLSDWKANEITENDSGYKHASPTIDDDYFEMGSESVDQHKMELRKRYTVAKYAYTPLPFVAQNHLPQHWITKSPGRDPFSLCRTFLGNIPTNRSCFDKCK